MEKFPIGIIGGTGGMGRWFAAFFEKEGHPVSVSGKDRGPRPAEMAAAKPTKSHEAYSKVYEQHLHGDHDDTPEELRRAL